MLCARSKNVEQKTEKKVRKSGNKTWPGFRKTDVTKLLQALVSSGKKRTEPCKFNVNEKTYQISALWSMTRTTSRFLLSQINFNKVSIPTK